MSKPYLSIIPSEALIDTPRTIRADGLQAGAQATITAHTVRGGGVIWESRIRVRASATGSVDLSCDAPISGSYKGVSPMGLIWSQTPKDAEQSDVFAENVMVPLRTTIRLETDEESCSASLIQHLSIEGTRRVEIRDAGLTGVLFIPASPGPHPAVIILNGSGGGINEPRGALYAAHGYLAFSLAYFKAPGLSDYISNTPLEYFKKAIDWLRHNYQPYSNFIALNGQSRGGELVLLLASLFPQDISAVVGYVPGAVVHSGQNAADPAVGRNGPAWLLNEKPLTHLWDNNRTASWAPFDEGPEPHRHELAILTALKDKEAVERARIRVENMQCPVILLSGTDDGAWPSSLYSGMVVDRLARTNFPHEVEWVDTPDAGHSIVFPYVPTTQLTHTHPVSRRVNTGGGRPDANALANEQSWERILAFLQRAVNQTPDNAKVSRFSEPHIENKESE